MKETKTGGANRDDPPAVVAPAGHLSCGVAGAGDALSGKLAAGGRIGPFYSVSVSLRSDEREREGQPKIWAYYATEPLLFHS